jgi:hypothetical protein
MILEFEINPALIRFLLLDPVTQDGPSVERRLGAFFVKIYMPPDELFCFVFLQFPPAAFPDLFSQISEIVRIFDYMDLHFTYSFLNGQKHKALSHRNGQGFNFIRGFPTWEERASIF